MPFWFCPMLFPNLLFLKCSLIIPPNSLPNNDDFVLFKFLLPNLSIKILILSKILFIGLSIYLFISSSKYIDIPMPIVTNPKENNIPFINSFSKYSFCCSVIFKLFVSNILLIRSSNFPLV